MSLLDEMVKLFTPSAESSNNGNSEVPVATAVTYPIVNLTEDDDFGTFHRIIDLPDPMEPSQADALLENGVLTIKMAKSAVAKAKTIPVKAE